MSDPAIPVSKRALDAQAAARLRARLASAGQAPWLHAESARRMAERLVVLRRAPQRVLDWSGTAGHVAGLLQAACPKARLQCVVGGAPSGRPAWWRRWWPGEGPDAGVAEIAEQDVADGSADLVWSAMDLHWQPDPPATLRRWHRALAPDGVLMFSTLGPGTLRGLRDLYAAVGWGSPMAALVDMHDLGDMLAEAGYAGPVMDQETLTLTWSTPEAALAELQGLGANTDPARRPGLRTPRWRTRLLAALAEHCGADGRVALQFELVYGHAIRGADSGPRVAAETRVGLDEMSAMLSRKRPAAPKSS